VHAHQPIPHLDWLAVNVSDSGQPVKPLIDDEDVQRSGFSIMTRFPHRHR
jgi:hypothetical protein